MNTCKDHLIQKSYLKGADEMELEGSCFAFGHVSLGFVWPQGYNFAFFLNNKHLPFTANI